MCVCSCVCALAYTCHLFLKLLLNTQQGTVQQFACISSKSLAEIQQLATSHHTLNSCWHLQQLVMCKMQLAELNESYLSTCHELHKAKEKNLAIAAKMTRYTSD